MVFENMSPALARELNETLLPHDSYLGALSVHFEYGPHLALYRSQIPITYRLQGYKVGVFYSMGNQDDCDEYELDEMTCFGYTDIEFEDTGAYRTILDDFDTPRHFERVAVFREMLMKSKIASEDEAYQLTMLLEDLSPKLFNALGAAAERLVQADNGEEVAQVAISGRRYIEQLADALFPPTNVQRDNRKLDKPAYKNRLWAFVEDNTLGEPKQLSKIGRDIDGLVKQLNVGLHSEQSKEEVSAALCNVAMLTAKLLILNPKGIRNGYLPYRDSIRRFLDELKSSSIQP